MIKHVKFFFILLCVMAGAGCLEPLEWNGGVVEPGLVVEARITTERTRHSVYLRQTRGIIVEGPGDGVSGAEVMITDGTSNFPLVEIAAGEYRTDSMAAEVGVDYHLTIVYEGKTYEATAQAIAATPQDPLEIRPWAGDPNNPSGEQYFEYTYRSNFGVEAPYDYSLSLQVPANVRDYYPPEWEVPRWLTNVLETPGRILRDSAYYLHPGLEPPALFAYGESTYAGFPYGTIVTEKFYSMTDEHYAFVRAVLAETDWRGLGPFGYIPADVPTNISGGAVGWFSVSDVTVVQQVVE